MKIKDILRKIINYNWKDKEKDTLQKKAIRIMIYFLITMIIFTFLSRFANRLTVPIVTTTSVKSDTISNNVRFDGVISGNKDSSISVTENLKVSMVNVEAGDNVKKDDVLIELDLNSIKENLDVVKKEIDKKEKAVIRAKEDYNIALKNEESTVATALEDMNKAKADLENTSEVDTETKVMLQQEYESKKSAYEEAKKDKDTNLLTYKRAIEDAEDESDTKNLKESLDKLNQLLSLEGKIRANEDTIVTNVFVVAGDVTTSSPVISLVDNGAGYTVKGVVSKDYKKNVTKGAKAEVILSSGKSIEDLEVKSVTVDKEQDSMLDVIIELPKNCGDIGSSVNCNIKGNEKKYKSCIPLGALREGQNEYFVLVTNEEDTILGKELKAKKVVVELKAKNNLMAAVDGLYLSSNQELIVDSNKSIEDGDKVRLVNK